MTKPNEKELIKQSWKKIPSFFKNNKFMKNIIDYIIDNKMDSLFFASTSMQMLNISSERKNPKFVLRIDSLNENVKLDYFSGSKMTKTKELSEEEAFSVIKSDLNRML